MRVLRFMSAGEALQLFAGATLENNTNHREMGQASDSIGFCFAIVHRHTDDDVALYEEAKWLSGIALLEVGLVGEITGKALRKFKKSHARYANGMHEERCTTKYSLDDFTDWAMYVPTGRSPLMVAFSGNWGAPQYILCKQDRC